MDGSWSLLAYICRKDGITAQVISISSSVQLKLQTRLLQSVTLPHHSGTPTVFVPDKDFLQNPEQKEARRQTFGQISANFIDS